MGVDRPRRGYASSPKPRVVATMDHGEAEAGTAVTFNSQGVNPDGSGNIFAREAREEARAMFRKEKEYRSNMHRRCLQKAAADAQSRKRLTQVNAPLQSTARPVIWGSDLYRGLWAKAAKIKETGS